MIKVHISMGFYFEGFYSDPGISGLVRAQIHPRITRNLDLIRVLMDIFQSLSGLVDDFCNPVCNLGA